MDQVGGEKWTFYDLQYVKALIERPWSLFSCLQWRETYETYIKTLDLHLLFRSDADETPQLHHLQSFTSLRLLRTPRQRERRARRPRYYSSVGAALCSGKYFSRGRYWKLLSLLLWWFWFNLRLICCRLIESNTRGQSEEAPTAASLLFTFPDEELSWNKLHF